MGSVGLHVLGLIPVNYKPDLGGFSFKAFKALLPLVKDTWGLFKEKYSSKALLFPLKSFSKVPL